MKMSLDVYEDLKGRIATIGKEKIDAHRDRVIAEGKARDVEKRVRWDALYALRYHDAVSEMYKTMDDSHIDTALRHIFRELGYSK